MNNLIQKISKIYSLTEVEIRLIQDTFKLKKIKESEFLLKEDALCDFEAFVQKGILRAYYNVDGKERIFRFYKEEQWVGDYKSLLKNIPSKFYIQAIEDCEILFLSKDDLERLEELLPNWNKAGKVFYERLFVENETFVETMLTTDPTQRYRQILERQPDLIHRIPLYYLAQYIGVQPETLSRIRKKITEE